MAIKGYFFNAVEQEGIYDRLYNNEDFCGYLANLVGNGVFPGDHLTVIPNNPQDMSVVVKPGHGWINGHKIINDSNYTLAIDSAPDITGYSRCDRIVFALDNENREMRIYVKKGTEAVSPTAPALVRTNSLYEMSLAIVRIDKGDTTILGTKITDTRDEADVCGRVAGLIQQIDISSIAAQYIERYEEILREMEEWEVATKAQYDSWFASLTDDLTIGAYIKQYRKIVQGPAANEIDLDMTNYTFDIKDLIHVTLNGLLLSPGIDYRIDSTTTPVKLLLMTEITTGNTLDILALKSSLEPSSGGLITSVVGDKFVYIANALPDENIKRMWINILGSTNNFAIMGRNLIRLDLFNGYTDDTLQFTKLSNDRIGITGSVGSSSKSCPLTLNKNAFIPGEKYTMSIHFDSISDDAQVAAGILINGTTGYAVDYSDDTVIFTIPDEFTSIALTLSASGINQSISGAVSLQIEYGAIAHDYNKVFYDAYTYDGSNTPKINDEITYIWIIDPDASGLKVAYIVMDSTTDGDSLLYPLENS